MELVGVFRNPGPQTREDLDGWDRVQMHGDEDEALLGQLERSVIRGFPFEPAAVRRWERCPHVELLLVDGPRGGSGRRFDHAQLAALQLEISKPVILAGGLTPETVADAIRTVRPWGVDVSSGVESSPGIKDAELVVSFCRRVREAEGRESDEAMRRSSG